MNKVGATSLGWGNIPLSDIFEQLARIGGETVEINGAPGRHAGLVLDEAGAPLVCGWAQQSGLSISGISGYCDFAQDERAALEAEIERLLASCRVAAALGAPIVRAFVGDAKPGRTYAQFQEHILWAFEQVAKRVEPLPVLVAVENHGRLANDGPLLAELVNRIGAANIRLTLDTGNFAWAGHDAAIVQADFDAVAPYVRNAHIKDGVWVNGGFDFVPAGSGDLPLAQWLAHLVESGYQGPLISEFEGKGDFIQGTSQSIAYLKAALQAAVAALPARG